jgi:single-stranded-DNA-specific exonuclease
MAGEWVSPPVDEGQVLSLVESLAIRPLTARMLVRRGITDVTSANRFLQPKLGELRAPTGIADLNLAIARMATALNTAEKIGVFGDYDVDGVTSAAVLATSLKALGGEVLARCASRNSGYGFGVAQAESFLAAGCQLVITADCGTSDHAAIGFLKEKGVDVVVIDHHQVPQGKSPALALINPHRSDDNFDFKGLASCGLAFYLMGALRTHLRGLGHARAASWDSRDLLDLVAMGTIADVMPLTLENRILVSAGLKCLSARARPGVAALFKVAGVDSSKPTTATDVGFKLAPRLNAAGRLGDAQLALDLLLAVDATEAERLALLLDEQNRNRQEVQEGVLSGAIAQVEAMIESAGGQLPSALVVGSEGWHHGVVGIVAAKLVDRYCRPAIVVGFHEGKGRGSARTILGFNLYQALAQSAEHLEVFGGHAAAAGLTVTDACFEAFRSAFVTQTARWFSERQAPNAFEVDAIVTLGELDLATADEIARLGPFGAANVEPIVVVPGVTVLSTRVVGTSHLQVTFRQNGATMDCIGFGMAAEVPAFGEVLDVVGFFEINEFRGSRKPRLRLKHLIKTTKSVA